MGWVRQELVNENVSWAQQRSSLSWYIILICTHFYKRTYQSEATSRTKASCWSISTLHRHPAPAPWTMHLWATLKLKPCWNALTYWARRIPIALAIWEKRRKQKLCCFATRPCTAMPWPVKLVFNGEGARVWSVLSQMKAPQSHALLPTLAFSTPPLLHQQGLQKQSLAVRICKRSENHETLLKWDSVHSEATSWSGGGALACDLNTMLNTMQATSTWHPAPWSASIPASQGKTARPHKILANDSRQGQVNWTVTPVRHANVLPCNFPAFHQKGRPLIKQVARSILPTQKTSKWPLLVVMYKWWHDRNLEHSSTYKESSESRIAIATSHQPTEK